MCEVINTLKFTIKFSFVVLFIIFNNSFAKVDSESWSSMGFGIKLPYSLKLDLEQSLRLKDNSSSFKQTFTETIISYNMFQKIKVFIPVRYAVFKNKIKKELVWVHHTSIIIKSLALDIDPYSKELISMKKSLIP